MKKILMATAVALCCWATMTVFTACSEDDENKPKEYTYQISLSTVGYTWTDDEVVNYKEWYAAVMGAYMTAIGVTTETFTLHGTLAECDKKVLEACQEAEKKVATFGGGTAIIKVRNVTTSKMVYTYNIKPASNV